MSETTHKRRWYQFSLKTLLIVVTVACVPLAWIGWRMQLARENREELAAATKGTREAVTAIEELGGKVTVAYAERPQTWLEEQFDDPGGADDPIRVLEVIEVRMRREFCRRYPTDADLEHLKGLTNLKHLDLGHTGVTDAGLEQLKGLTELRTLILDNTRVTDAGLEHLTGLTKLESLNLSVTKVSDAGLEHLKRLTNLGSLNLRFTQVTHEGVDELYRTFPNCDFHYYSGRRTSPPRATKSPPAGAF